VPDPALLPAVNAGLNGLATLLLLGGRLAIHLRRVRVHRACMGSAFLVSVLFLISYLVYHATRLHTAFAGEGAVRAFYYALLTSHVVLAAAVPPLALVTLYRALRGDFERHRRLARWTFPVWLYVSVTGVVVYFMLYRWFAAG
jgi:putative membrane protein